MNGTRTTASLGEAARAGALGALLAVAGATGRAGEALEGYFDDPVPVVELNSPGSWDGSPVVSHDGRTLIFASGRAGGAGGYDLYVAERGEAAGRFTMIPDLEEINSSSDDFAGCLSDDGRELFFTSNRPGGAGGWDLYVTRRDDRKALFGLPSPLTGLNDSENQSYPWISRDGRELYFVWGPNRGIWVAQRGGPGEDFTAPPEFVFNTEYGEIAPRLSCDGSTLFLSDWAPGPRPGGMGELDVWMLARSDPGAAFTDPPTNLGAPINTPACEAALSVSCDWPSDGATVYFSRSATCEFATNDIYQATWHVLPPPGPSFLRGDCDGNGALELTDAVRDLRFCFSGQSVPCAAACDADGDGNPCSGVTDGLRILMLLFRGGAPLPAPYPECGPSELPSDAELGCEESPCGT